MNTFGKILVMCVFLLSLGAAGLCIFVVSTTTNWKKHSDSLNERLTVAQTNNDPLAQSNSKLNQQIKEELIAKTTANQKLDEETARLKGEMTGKDEKISELQLTITGMQVAMEKQRLDYSRMLEENKQMLEAKLKREAYIVSQDETLATVRREKQDLKNANVSLENRLKDLEEKFQASEQRFIALKPDTGVSSSFIKRDPNQPNPPALHVKGVIAKIDPTNKNYVQLSVGTDHGVNRNHTLEVYRLQPRPQYLGYVRILDSDFHSSVGQMMRTPPTPLLVGDIVESPILP